jgi:hypothetical protein
MDDFVITRPDERPCSLPMSYEDKAPELLHGIGQRSAFFTRHSEEGTSLEADVKFCTASRQRPDHFLCGDRTLYTKLRVLEKLGQNMIGLLGLVSMILIL